MHTPLDEVGGEADDAARRRRENALVWTNSISIGRNLLQTAVDDQLLCTGAIQKDSAVHTS